MAASAASGSDVRIATAVTLTRIDGQVGSLVEQRKISEVERIVAFGIPPSPRLHGEDLGLVGSDAADAVQCIARIPVDGSEASVLWLTPKPKRALLQTGSWPATSMDDGVLVVAADGEEGAGYISGDDTNLPSPLTR